MENSFVVALQVLLEGVENGSLIALYVLSEGGRKWLCNVLVGTFRRGWKMGLKWLCKYFRGG